ncbi:outer membrane protein assembly factor BamD [Hyphomicrobium sp. 1Nfss2.1]|uniref:outer membrane protein assembly factor BamD n=1 Tax=Hyphomicrobium sp. 1Nfss2.1 TaxID=3413936 RepID=UPI003C7BC523
MSVRQLLQGMTLAAATALVAGCASSGDAARMLNPDPPSKMFADADVLQSKGKFEDAAKKFEDVDREHPYSPEARRSIVMAAYAYYKAGKLPEAIAAAERYTTMHPGTKEAPLAHHIIAQSYFEQMKQPNRDQDATRKALAQLKTLKTRYPDSTYAQKADNQIRLCEDTLAAQEMEVGRYYLKSGNHVAAINRFKAVVSEYQTTAHVEEALYRLTASYLSLGIAPEAQNAAAVLGYNFPNSSWYKDSYALLQKQGLMPQVSQGSWMTDVLKAPKNPAPPPASAPAPAAPAPPATSTPDWGTTTNPPPPSTLGGPRPSS